MKPERFIFFAVGAALIVVSVAVLITWTPTPGLTDGLPWLIVRLGGGQ